VQRVRRQARSVGCQANLRQWGILYAAYTSQNDGYLPPWDETKIDVYDPFWEAWRWSWEMLGAHGTAERSRPDRASFAAVEDLLRCPMVVKPRLSTDDRPGPVGGTFRPWTWWFSDPAPGWLPGWHWCSSYAPSHPAHSRPRNGPDPPNMTYDLRVMWMTCAVRNAAAVPAFLDSAWFWPEVYMEEATPPVCDAIPCVDPTDWRGSSVCHSVCMNRHNAGTNSLFLDWSVRKVGLKELWTLKWHTQYNTRGPWTKAGGARPEDWPPWMRRFKDY
jgi:prepilin-type processing-associated H-X9-DG protein